jgi:hypothetical protein
MPATELGTVIRLLLLVVFLWFRGLRFRERPEEEIAAGDLLRIDACATVSWSMMNTRLLTAVYFHKRHLELALRAGEPHRVLRALLFALGFAAAGGGGDAPTRSASMLERRVLPLIERLRGSSARFAAYEGSIEMVRGLASTFRGRFREAREHLERAVLRFEASPGSIANEVAFAAMFLVNVLYSLGEWKEMARRVAAFLEEARARGDIFLEVEMSKVGSLSALIRNPARMTAMLLPGKWS